MAFTMLRRGRLIAVPPPETAERFLATEESDGSRCGGGRSSARAAQVRAGIEEAAAEYGAEEVIVVTITYDHGARRRSYELIAEEFGLSRATSRRLIAGRPVSVTDSQASAPWTRSSPSGRDPKGHLEGARRSTSTEPTTRVIHDRSLDPD